MIWLKVQAKPLHLQMVTSYQGITCSAFVHFAIGWSDTWKMTIKYLFIKLTDSKEALDNNPHSPGLTDFTKYLVFLCLFIHEFVEVIRLNWWTGAALTPWLLNRWCLFYKVLCSSWWKIPDLPQLRPCLLLSVGFGSVSLQAIWTWTLATAVGHKALEVSSWCHFTPSHHCLCPLPLRGSRRELDPEVRQLWRRPGSLEKTSLSPSCPPALHCYCQEFAFAKRDRSHFQLYQLELKFLHYEFVDLINTFT